uniref:Uncharacterized protein n=1 Tax=Micrurus lemniscatus lemniscatus TaxID=129467 RepID=A0A2D4HMK0_MICLE
MNFNEIVLLFRKSSLSCMLNKRQITPPFSSAVPEVKTAERCAANGPSATAIFKTCAFHGEKAVNFPVSACNGLYHFGIRLRRIPWYSEGFFPGTEAVVRSI